MRPTLCAAFRFHRAEWNSSDPCNTYGNNRDFAQTKLHCLQLNASVGMQRVKAKVFIQDPFNSVLFTEDSERYVDVRNIVCALTSYNLLQWRYLTVWRRWCYSSPWCVSTYIPMKSSLLKRQLRQLRSNYSRWSTAWLDSKQKKGAVRKRFFQLSSKQIWETMPANIFGDQGNLSLNHFREQLVLLMGNKR